jgi:bifunctional non-homologous end joining protein LigD
MPVKPKPAIRGHSGRPAQSGVEITHPDKPLWPRDGITKGDLATYYRDLAPVILPHLRDRPLVMKPFPQGIESKPYFRQTLPKTAPPWLPSYQHVAKADSRPNVMPIANSADVLMWLANQAAIELHAWLSRTDSPATPDYAVFDLDVMTDEHFPLALRGAVLVRDRLREQGLDTYAKTSGGDGVHIYLPIDRGPDYGQVRAWAEQTALELAAQHPDLFATDARRAGREHKVLIDYAQNSLGRTTVAVYSVRPRPGATVSTPVTWDEVESGAIAPGDFTIKTVPARLAQSGDLFAPVLMGGQLLPGRTKSGNSDGRKAMVERAGADDT